MSAESFVWRGQRHMRVNPSVYDVAIHADYIRWLSGIFHEHILRWKIAVADLVYLVAAHRTNPAENDGVANLLLLDHLLHSGEQIGVELEPKDQNAVELTFDSENVGDLVAVGFGIFGRRRRRLHEVATSFLCCEDSRQGNEDNGC